MWGLGFKVQVQGLRTIGDERETVGSGILEWRGEERRGEEKRRCEEGVAEAGGGPLRQSAHSHHAACDASKSG